jgi:hypothetical protein
MVNAGVIPASRKPRKLFDRGGIVRDVSSLIRTLHVSHQEDSTYNRTTKRVLKSGAMAIQHKTPPQTKTLSAVHLAMGRRANK